MRGGVLVYSAGVCHGLAAAWFVGYAMHKLAVPLDDLYSPSRGVLVSPVAGLLLVGGGTLIQLAARRSAARRPAEA